MDCADFIENHSDFLDRRFEAFPLAGYRDHIRSCPSCARYDRVIQSGLTLIHELELEEAGLAFDAGLQRKFLHLQEALARQQARLSRTAWTALAATAALVAVVATPVLSGRGPVELPPVVVDTPATPNRATSLFGLRSSVATSDPLLDLASRPWLLPRDDGLPLFRPPLRPVSLGERPPGEIVTGE